MITVDNLYGQMERPETLGINVIISILYCFILDSKQSNECISLNMMCVLYVLYVLYAV